MRVNHVSEIGDAPLRVRVQELSPYVISQWIGVASDAAHETLSRATAELLACQGARLVLDLGRLGEVSKDAERLLTHVINEAQRTGRSVTLVQCSDSLYRRLRRAGANGVINHAVSVISATHGRGGDPEGSVDLYLRSAIETLPRVRSVAGAVAHQAGLDEEGVAAVCSAVSEAAANAMTHGSPDGCRNHVRVSFHLLHTRLVIDIADQGRGFEPQNAPTMRGDDLSVTGLGLKLITGLVDRVEYFRDEAGMLVRLTKDLGTPLPKWLN